MQLAVKIKINRPKQLRLCNWFMRKVQNRLNTFNTMNKRKTGSDNMYQIACFINLHHISFNPILNVKKKC